jgi:hypothetical protein
LTAAGDVDDTHVRYRGSFECATTGRYGVTVRIVPSHPGLVSSAELGRMVWA